MVSFPLGLVIWHNNTQMELIFLTLDDFSDSFSHLTYKIYIKLAVKLVAFIFFQTFDSLTFSKMLPYNSYNSFFHFFLQNMIFALSVYLIQKLFFAFFVCFTCLLLRHSNFSLMFKIFLEHLIILTRQSFHGDCYLLAEVIVAVLAVRPDNQLLKRQNVRGLRLRLG
jgi:hypothetical protein